MVVRSLHRLTFGIDLVQTTITRISPVRDVHKPSVVTRMDLLKILLEDFADELVILRVDYWFHFNARKQE